MGANILVMGGTLFQGKRLVQRLLDEGWTVTIATRGRTPDPFGDQVTRLTFDRRDAQSMRRAFGDRPFDIVFDQIGYAPDDMEDAVEVFSGRIGRYVFTSSSAVYDGWGTVREENFDPLLIEPESGRYPPLEYGEGKRRAEAYLFQNAPFPVTAARLPIIIGPDDPSGRFQFHVERIMQGRPIVVPPGCGRRTFISADDAGRFLAWLGLTERVGPYNGASSEAVNAIEVTSKIGHALQKQPMLRESGSLNDTSPYFIEEDFIVDNSRAVREGFQFTPLDQWLPRMAQQAAQALKTGAGKQV